MASVAVESPARTPLGQQAAEVLDSLKRLRRLSDREIALRSGLPRSTVQSRRTSTTPIDLDDMSRLAVALNVDPLVFLMDPVSAMRWVLDHAPTLETPYDRREVLEQSSPWITPLTLDVLLTALGTSWGLLPDLVDGDVVRLWPRVVPDDDGREVEVPAPAPTGDELRPAA